MSRVFIFCLILGLPTLASAAVVKRVDRDKSCTRYSVRNQQEDAQGNLLPLRLAAGESVVARGTQYGLSFKDLDIRFDRLIINFKVMKNAVLMVNTELFSERVKVSNGNPLLPRVEKMVNDHKQIAQEICIASDGELFDLVF